MTGSCVNLQEGSTGFLGISSYQESIKGALAGNRPSQHELLKERQTLIHASRAGAVKLGSSQTNFHQASGDTLDMNSAKAPKNYKVTSGKEMASVSKAHHYKLGLHSISPTKHIEERGEYEKQLGSIIEKRGDFVKKAKHLTSKITKTSVLFGLTGGLYETH